MAGLTAAAYLTRAGRSVLVCERGDRLKAAGFRYRLFVGNTRISFRMYRDGFHSFIEGWTKNFASGAAKTPLWLFCLVFVWVMGCASVPFRMIVSVLVGDWATLIANATLIVP